MRHKFAREHESVNQQPFGDPTSYLERTGENQDEVFSANGSLAISTRKYTCTNRTTKPSGWVETYSPSNRNGEYYRFGYVPKGSGTPVWVHIKGGNVNAPEAQRRKSEVEAAIATGLPPEQIAQMC